MKQLVLALLLVSACTPASPPATPAPGPATTASGEPTAASVAERYREVQWFRTAAEYRALALQTYRAAGERLRELEAPLADGSWAVIIDADETLLDNSLFEKRIAEAGEAFTEEAWDAWVLEEAATAIPGSAEFVALVHRLGGRVAVVTNRHQGICPATVANLHALGIRPDVVLCETETSEKEPRFAMVAEGTASPALGPLRPILWIGDNVGDFPDLDQSLRNAGADAYRLFGDRYFVLPNPMYGSWMRNEWR
ncbi:MAG TPA: HAD family acid phosphatase [Longimicrobiales bacterium]|nr:HAD family acid phosphatase [Longimicrobiales bacterium]